jgi:CubicO group peptidase (beta-lactamase class C family)
VAPGAETSGSQTVYVLDVDDVTDLIADWPVERAVVAVTDADATVGIGGEPTWVTGVASIAKLMVGLAALVALEEETIALDEPAGPDGATVEHLLAHASGLAFDSQRMLSAPGRRRIYSNTGIEAFCRHLEERAGMAVSDYLTMGVFEPLGMTATTLHGSPAHDIDSSANDLLALAREFLRPTLVSAATLADATRAHFPDLPGVLPGVGSFDPNPWGLTFEIRANKRPHWTGTSNSPETFGHFGGSGTFLWVDPAVGLATVSLAAREFDQWAMAAWPKLSEAVLDRYT